LAFFINDTVEALDLTAFHARYEKGGPRNQPFHPANDGQGAAVQLCDGVFSSRKIAAKLHEDVAFRVLAAGNSPAHRTIRDFRQAGHHRGGWHQGQGQREPSQGHELRAYAQG